MGVKKPEMQFSSLQIAWLIAFVESADHKRTSAAAILGVTQSTVTKYIEKLESWYGGGPRRLLMLPNRHPPALTKEGEAFLPDARKVLDLLRAAQPEPGKFEPPKPRVSAEHIQVPKPRPTET